jgi:hypothetical protein
MILAEDFCVEKGEIHSILEIQGLFNGKLFVYNDTFIKL